MYSKKLFQLLFGATLLLPVGLSAQWQAVRNDSVNAFTKVFNVDGTTVFSLGQGGLSGTDNFIVRSNNNGNQWDSIQVNPANASYQLGALFFADVNNGFAGGLKNNSNQLLIKTTDNGTTWTEITPDPSATQPVRDVYFLDAQQGFATDAQKLYTTTDGGASWSAIVLPFVVENIHFTSATDGIATGTQLNGSYGVIMKTTDGGQTWMQVYIDFNPNMFVSYFGRIDFADPTTVFTVLGYSNKLYRSTDGGSTWTPIVVDSVQVIRDFDFSSPVHGHVLSDMGQIFVTQNACANWGLEYATAWGFYGPSIWLYSISFIGNTGFSCGTSGLIKRHNEPNAIQENASGNTLNIYPNPVSRFENLVIDAAGFSGETSVTILSSSGQVVFEKTYDMQQGEPAIVAGLEVANGIYIIRVANDKMAKQEKLVVCE